MHGLGQLHKRLAAAFQRLTAHRDGERVSNAVAHQTEVVSTFPRDRVGRKLLSWWLGGLGIVAGSVLVATAEAGSPLLLSICLGFAALSCVVLLAILSTVRQRTTRNPIGVSSAWSQGAALFAGIHDTLGDITVTRNMDRRIVGANETFRRLTGRLNAEGLTCEEIGIAFRPGPAPHRFEVEISTPEGQRIYFWRDVVTRDPGDGRLLLQSIARDVTEERLAAQAREEARQKRKEKRLLQLYGAKP